MSIVLDILPAIAVLVMGYILGYTTGYDIPKINPEQGYGVPIHNLDLSSDGLTIKFSVGQIEMFAPLVRPTSRPPNIERAAYVFVDGDSLMFVDTEGRDVFGTPIPYTPPLKFVTE